MAYVLRLTYGHHTRTFRFEDSINKFLGVYEGLEHEPLTVVTYVKSRKCELWGDGTLMTPEEWVDCCKAIYKEFG